MEDAHESTLLPILHQVGAVLVLYQMILVVIILLSDCHSSGGVCHGGAVGRAHEPRRARSQHAIFVLSPLLLLLVDKQLVHDLRVIPEVEALLMICLVGSVRELLLSLVDDLPRRAVKVRDVQLKLVV